MKRTVFGGLCSAAMACIIVVGFSAAPAFADTRGTYPGFKIDCGALRDIPKDWTAVSGGECPGYGYSYVLTNPSNVHYAYWEFGFGYTTVAFKFPVEVWVPSKYAGAQVEYDFNYCDSPNTWHLIGYLNQGQDSGWYTPGSVTVGNNRFLCDIREHNVGSGQWDLAEDALGLQYAP